MDTRYSGLENNFGISGFGILIARTWVNKIIDVKHVNGRLMMIKLFIGKQMVAIVLTDVLQQRLAEDVKEKLSVDSVSLVSKASENE